MNNIEQIIADDLKKSLEVLKKGGLILYPTDTVWGIGCDATNPEAVAKVYALKQRADSKALLLLADSMARVAAYVEDIPSIAWDLTELSEKPLTIIYPQGKLLAPNLLAEDGSVGIRVTTELFSQRLCAAFRRPIVSTSANISACPTPANYAEIADEIRNGVDYVVNYQRNDKEKKQASGIIKLEKNGTFVLIRQ